MRPPYWLLAVPFAACASDSRPSVETASSRATLNAPAEPVFEVDMWPGEGRPEIQAIRSNLSLVQAPRLGAPVVATLVVKPGQRLEYDSTRFQTMSATGLQIRAAGTIKGRRLGPIRYLSSTEYYSGAFNDTIFAVVPTSVVEFLQYRAEGSCFVRILGDVIDAETCPTLDTITFATTSRPQTLWWIHVRATTGVGWLQINDTTAKVVNRTF